MRTILTLFLAGVCLSGCMTVSHTFSPGHKYGPDALQKDYEIYRKVLESHHPGLYWYTAKDSMDLYFEEGREQLKDSLTEPQFRNVLNRVTARINCGHTVVRASKEWSRYADTVRIRSLFPLSFKVWEDAMVVTGSLHRSDSVLRRGTVVTAINGLPWDRIADTLFGYIAADGYNRTHKYQSLSNRGFFGSLYTGLFGPSDNYRISYRDPLNREQTVTVPAYRPEADTAGRAGTRSFRSSTPPTQRQRREQRLNAVRLLRIDSVNRTAMMDLGSFARGYRLKSFFRRSFRTVARQNIGHLIIDLRSNGGGSVTNSTLITRYLAKSPFRMADTLYAIRKKGPWGKYIRNHFWNRLFMTVFARKRKDGFYHFGYFERHAFRPKRKHHFGGQVYLLTGGNTFSAATLMAVSLVRQNNVTVVGEETGGGAHGNSAWLIPDVELPLTGVRFRLPLFRLVIDRSFPHDGHGLMPEVPSLPTVERIRRNTDFKVETAMELIRADKRKTQ